MCLLLLFIFFYEIPKYVQTYSSILSFFMDWHTWIGILWKWDSPLTELAYDGECTLAWLNAIRNFIANETYLFQGYLFTWPAHFI